MKNFDFAAVNALISEVLTKSASALYKILGFVAFLCSKGSARSENRVIKIWHSFGFVYTKVAWWLHMAITVQPS